MALGTGRPHPQLGFAVAACCLGLGFPVHAAALHASAKPYTKGSKILIKEIQRNVRATEIKQMPGRDKFHLPPVRAQRLHESDLGGPTTRAPHYELSLPGMSRFVGDPVWDACIKRYPPYKEPTLCPDSGPTELNIDGANQDPVQCLQEMLPTVRAKNCQLSGELEDATAASMGSRDPFGWACLDRFEAQMGSDGKEVVGLLQDAMGLQAQFPAYANYDTFFNRVDKDHLGFLDINEAEDVLPGHGHGGMLMDIADLDGDHRVSKRELQIFLQAVFCFSDVAQPVTLRGKPLDKMEGFATYKTYFWLKFRM